MNPYSLLKVYLAAPFEDRDEMLSLRSVLASRGVLVTSTWLTPADGNHNNMAAIANKFHECRCRAIKDIEDILAADVFILRKPKEKHRVPTTGGHHVELGLCLGLGKPIILFGARENVFHYLPGVQVVETLPELLSVLKVGE
jgi:nucleoside 2-deoxyribosyltransferase